MAAQTQAPAPGCVLPQVDSPPPVAQAAPPAPAPVYPIEAPGAGLAVNPLLLALGAIAAGTLIYFLVRDNDHHNNESPV